ncbi:MAG: hemerythrin domain-containing protein [Bacteroidota bacterium]
MYKTTRTYIKPDIVMAELVFENPYMLLLMEHFGLDLVVHEKTVSQLCHENSIEESVFISFANLYNGFSLSGEEKFSSDHIGLIIRFLNNSHSYFKNDKYPEIQGYIRGLFDKNPTAEIKLIERFFDDYFKEVSEHLDYEENVAFPYFQLLVGNRELNDFPLKSEFSGSEYLEHHTDIESKLIDLKNLLMRHVSLKNDPVNRRKLLFSLIELEFVLNIHSLIEESVLIPLIINLESKRNID